MRKTLIILLVAALFSCSFRDGDSNTEKAEVPDMILINANYTMGRSGEAPVFIESDSITFYSEKNLAITENLSFTRYDNEGDISITGRADLGEIDTDRNIMNLRGNVFIEKKEGSMVIMAEEAVFDSDNNELEAPGSVYVKSEDGEFRGTGFHADLITSFYSFESIDEGVLTL